MALRRQSLSPTAHLLRNSRLFSLPNPLPRPVVGETTGAGVTKASDSATLPYPTHQAIATTRSSRARGDWGLKRNLPARSHMLQTSDPVLRITQLDTIEHVTDFDSAADHVRTRQKWEQMGVPVMKGMQQLRKVDMTGPPPVSAFETRDDTTAYSDAAGLDESGLFLAALQQNKRARHAAQAAAAAPVPFSPFKPPPVDAAVHNTRRWKHDGPWLPGQSADEFVAYLSREIAKRRHQFNAYLREFVRNEIYTTRQLAAARAGDTAPIDPIDAAQWQKDRERAWAHITAADIATAIRALRRETANDPIGSKLVQKLIVPFLRLPTIRFKYKAYSEDASTQDFQKYVFDHESAPLSTHPSAGLGYLRTKSYLASHPILGPQATTTPVPARVLQARQTAFSREPYARLGVAGFVTNDQYRAMDAPSSSRPSFHNAHDVETIDIDSPGGKKLLVTPQFAALSNDGRVHLKITRAGGAEIAVARGEVEDRPPPVNAGGDAGYSLFGRDDRFGLWQGNGNGNGKGNRRGRPNAGFGFAKQGVRSGIKQLDELTARSAGSLNSGLDSRRREAEGDAAAAAQELGEASEQGRRLEQFLGSSSGLNTSAPGQGQ